MTNAPDLGDVLAGSLRDIWPALRSWGGWAIAAVISVTAACAWIFPLLPLTQQQLGQQDEMRVFGALGIALFFVVPSTFFALASAVRTVKPEFVMTLGVFFGMFGYTIVVGLAMLLGFVLLVIPGLYVMVKLTLAPYFYLVRDRDEDPIGQAWALTRDRFWLTAALFVVVGIGSEVATYASQVIAALLFAIRPGLVIVAIPLCVAAYFAAIQFQYNAYMRWVYALKTSSTLSNTGIAVPPTVTP